MFADVWQSRETGLSNRSLGDRHGGMRTIVRSREDRVGKALLRTAGCERAAMV